MTEQYSEVVTAGQAQQALTDPSLDARARIQAMMDRLLDSDAVTVPKDLLRAAFSLTVTRYAIVSDDDGHDYVIEANHRDEFFELDDDAINDGQSWMWSIGGAPSQVTFAEPEIFGKPINR